MSRECPSEDFVVPLAEFQVCLGKGPIHVASYRLGGALLMWEPNQLEEGPPVNYTLFLGTAHAR